MRFCFSTYRRLRDLHSFPTRRSSDLPCAPLESGSAILAEDQKTARFAGQSTQRHRWIAGSGRWRGPTPEHSSGLAAGAFGCMERSEEHTSELQSRSDLVCRLLLEKKN